MSGLGFVFVLFVCCLLRVSGFVVCWRRRMSSRMRVSLFDVCCLFCLFVETEEKLFVCFLGRENR